MVKKTKRVLLVKIGSVLIFLIAFASVHAWADDVTVTAKVDRNQLRPGDTLTYTISISSKGSTSFEDPKLPDLSAFEMVNSWSSSEMRGSFTNGTVETVRSQMFNWQLSPTREGKITIGAAEVVAGGQTYKTQPIQITATNAAPQAPSRQAPQQQLGQNGQQGQQPGDAGDDDDDDVFSQLLKRQLGQGGGIQRGVPSLPPANANDIYFIHAEADKNKVYAGEQVTVSFYLVTRGQIADIDTLKYPDLKGFWKEDIEIATRLNFQPEIVNGVQYQRAILASYALFPIKPGLSKIDPYRAKCKVIVADQMGQPRGQDIIKESGEIPIEVLALPEANKPANFSGGVGEFTANALVDNSHVKAGAPVTLRVHLEGQGNAKFADMPKLDMGAAAQVYEPKTKMKFFPNGRSYKDFEVTVVPRQAGELKIPPIDFVFFSPSKRAYYSAKTSEISIQVDPGDGNQALPTEPMKDKEIAPVAAEPAKPTMPDILVSADDHAPVSMAANLGIWSAIFLLTLATLGGFLWRELNGREQRENLQQKIDKRLKKLDAALSRGDYREVGRSATETIHQVLGEVAGLGGASYEFDKLAEQAPPSFKRELVPQIRTLLARLEVAGYAPENMIGELRDKSELKKLIAETRRLLVLAAKYDFAKSEDSNRSPSESPV